MCGWLSRGSNLLLPALRPPAIAGGHFYHFAILMDSISLDPPSPYLQSSPSSLQFQWISLGWTHYQSFSGFHHQSCNHHCPFCNLSRQNMCPQVLVTPPSRKLLPIETFPTEITSNSPQGKIWTDGSGRHLYRKSKLCLPCTICSCSGDVICSLS